METSLEEYFGGDADQPKVGLPVSSYSPFLGNIIDKTLHSAKQKPLKFGAMKPDFR